MERLEKAKEFLTNHPKESKTTAARIYNINVKTLTSSIRRPEGRKNGGQNQILREHEARSITGFIKSLLMHGILPTHQMVFKAIVSLKKAHNPLEVGPSRRWFRSWWKCNKLHKIKTKPLAMIRYEAAQESDVIEWFERYREVLKELKIRKSRNILNFDEAGFRVGCMRGQEIIVPEEIKQFYAVSSENRRSATVIETINAAGDYPPPPMIIVQGHDIMATWFLEGVPEGTYVVPSNSGFTSDKIAIEYLKHLIKHTNAGPDAEWQLLLMDNHGSHTTPEFSLLANENRIRPFPFIPHLTHCMQPLDVGVFQPYKHWHCKAIEEVVASSFVEYSLSQFIQDLTKIRNHTFKTSTIRHAFEKSGMWPIDPKACIRQLKNFNPNDPNDSLNSLNNEPSLPLPLPRQIQPTKVADIEYGLSQWGPKIRKSMQWSDPARAEEWDSFVDNTNEVVSNAIIDGTELEMHRESRRSQLNNRRMSRKRLRPETGRLGITAEDAKQAIAIRLQQDQEAEEKRANNSFMKLWRIERDEMHVKGLAARKAERDRVKQLKEMQKMLGPIPIKMYEKIPDPEALWKATNEVWIAEEAKKEIRKNPRANVNEEDVTFIVDSTGHGDNSILPDLPEGETWLRVRVLA